VNVTKATKEELLAVIEEVKLQDTAMRNLKLKIHPLTASQEIRKAVALFDASPQHLTMFAELGDLKGMKGVVGARQSLIDFIIRKHVPVQLL
jgi:hypothetical protein